MNKNYKKPRYKKPVLETKDFIVKNNCELLAFLYECFPSKGRNDVKALLSTHRVLVNGAMISQYNFALFPGDKVQITEHSFHQEVGLSNKFKIIYEDDNLIAIDKPVGLLSVATAKEKTNNVESLLNAYVQQKDKHNRIFMVHRIDEDTSGVMIVAKNQRMHDALISDWNNLVIKRGYYTIVEGHMKEKEGTFSSYLKKNSQYMMYSSKDNKGQYAETHYKVIDENDNYSLLDVDIKTGRKNQIRVHLYENGHTVIGDDKYGEPSNPIDRLGLHAYELKIKNPLSGKIMDFKCQMPKEFKELFVKK
ncbi:MAG: RluA family pseudouridine synthase [Coprobacillus sp.]|nr:RluA family pseudouridine synthase [Coprobacillus sp.]